MATANIPLPDIRSVVTPVLQCLPGAAVSTEPPTSVLPALSPVLRQRAQFLSSASMEPWIRLLSYEPAKVSQLTSIARSGDLDPHPASGEVELDWDRAARITYKRIDEETLQGMVVLKEFGLFFRLVWCVNDPDGGDGWRVGEVGVSDSTAFTNFGGHPSIAEAETAFQTAPSQPATNGSLAPNRPQPWNHTAHNGNENDNGDDDDDDDDDDYWARYDATPSRTPAVNRSPAPRTAASQPAPSAAPVHASNPANTADEDAYFAQYDSVQPALDNHDPDEEANVREHAADLLEPLRPKDPASLLANGAAAAAAAAAAAKDEASVAAARQQHNPDLAHPIPTRSSSGSRGNRSRSRSQEHEDGESSWVTAPANPRRLSASSSSGASETVAKLESVAESRHQAEFGVRQHVARSIRSLFLLSKASGIDREEFERMVKTELDVLGMVEEDV
ncbi:hypothetical protein VTJ83DRAFT_2330 [Remersonia thermophila]|uniref:Uncharacterized protein n=1 Tax=Remersonia thermophila TaxID=72144 RepID=A0ABR4DIN6_9PEZI